MSDPSPKRILGRNSYSVPCPKPHTEHVIEYYPYAGKVFERHFGVKPSRTSLWTYLKQGFPVHRGGPYVKMPVFLRFRSQMTTKEAMDRFVKLVKKLEREHIIRRFE